MAVLPINIQRQSGPIPPPLIIRYKGIWDMQDLYESTASYLRERKWFFNEKSYKHKHPSPFGVERQYVWSANRRVDEWLEVFMSIFIHTYDAHDVEVVRNGQRKLLTEGKILIQMKSMMKWDTSERWESSPFWVWMKDFLTKYLLKKRIEQGYSARYRQEIVDLYHFMQRKLRMESRDNSYTHAAGVHRRGPA